MIMERHGGNFPTSYADILALPRRGPYTAGAIASTAYNEEVPCVDGNVERVLSRVFDIDTPVKEEPAKSRIRELAQALIPKGEARNFNQGLMELGALVCRKKARVRQLPAGRAVRKPPPRHPERTPGSRQESRRHADRGSVRGAPA